MICNIILTAGHEAYLLQLTVRGHPCRRLCRRVKHYHILHAERCARLQGAGRACLPEAHRLADRCSPAQPESTPTPVSLQPWPLPSSPVLAFVEPLKGSSCHLSSLKHIKHEAKDNENAEVALSARSEYSATPSMPCSLFCSPCQEVPAS